jgi:hypothetical protein
MRKATKNLSQDNRPPGCDLNPETPEYEVGWLVGWLVNEKEIYTLIKSGVSDYINLLVRY